MSSAEWAISRYLIVLSTIDLDGLGERAEDGRPGDDDLLADADEDLGVVAEGLVDEVEVLDDDPAVVRDGLEDGLGQLVLLVEGQLVAGVDVEGVAGEGVGGVEVVEGRRPDVDALVVVGQLEAREEPLDQGRLARALGAEDADEEVGRGEVLLGQLGGDHVQPVAAARGVVRRVEQRLAVDGARAELHHGPLLQ